MIQHCWRHGWRMCSGGIAVLFFLVMNVTSVAISPVFLGTDIAGNIQEKPLSEWTGLTDNTCSMWQSISPKIPPPLNLTAAQTPSSCIVELRDGSRLVVRRFTLQSNRTEWEDTNGKLVSLPLTAVSGVRFVVPQSMDIFRAPPEWIRLGQTHTEGDRLVILSFDHHEGVVEEIDDETILFHLDGERLPVKRAANKIFGILFKRQEPVSSPSGAVTLFRSDGSVLTLSSFCITDTDIQWETPSSLTGKTTLTEMVRLDCGRTNVLFLTRLQPTAVTWQPPIQWEKSPTTRLSVDTQAGKSQPSPSVEAILSRFTHLQTSVDTHKDGNVGSGFGSESDSLSLSAGTTVTYTLPKFCQTFRATVGVPDVQRPFGQSRLMIFGDGHLLWDEVIRGDQPPVRVELSVENRTTLTFQVQSVSGYHPGSRLKIAAPQLRSIP